MHFFDSKASLIDMIHNIHEKKFRAQQLWDWIYIKGSRSFAEMTDLPVALRQKLDSIANIDRPSNKKELVSRDGTMKWLLELGDKNEIETVFIPERTRGTVCVSSQVGCTLTCKFCHTGTQKLVRNLTAFEILSQVMLVKDKIDDWPVVNDKKLTNIVFMGMGEPMLNYENVATAVKILTETMQYGRRRVTISTSGLIPQIERCSEELGVRLAISLHAVTDDVRNELVPINKKYPIKDLMKACRRYADIVNDRITFEYVMLDGVNDSDADAKRLISLLQDIPSKVNLIPFNPWPGAPYRCSTRERMERFARIVEDAGYKTPIRVTRGQDIMAACGQLKSESLKKNQRATSCTAGAEAA